MPNINADKLFAELAFAKDGSILDTAIDTISNHFRRQLDMDPNILKDGVDGDVLQSAISTLKTTLNKAGNVNDVHVLAENLGQQFASIIEFPEHFITEELPQSGVDTLHGFMKQSAEKTLNIRDVWKAEVEAAKPLKFHNVSSKRTLDKHYIADDPWADVGEQASAVTPSSQPTALAVETPTAPLPETANSAAETATKANKWQEFVTKNQRLVGGAEMAAGVSGTLALNHRRQEVNTRLQDKLDQGGKLTLGDRAEQLAVHSAMLGTVVVSADGFSRATTKQGLGYWAQKAAQGVGQALHR